jgi:hypothetical protein
MKTIKVSEATPAQLDWLVAKCEGLLEPMFDEKEPRVVLQVDPYDVLPIWNPSPQVYYQWKYLPSTSWEVGGPIIDREKITLTYDREWNFDPAYPEDNGDRWLATIHGCTDLDMPLWQAYGPTPLIAAMRCYVASELGEEVEIPEEL